MLNSSIDGRRRACKRNGRCGWESSDDPYDCRVRAHAFAEASAGTECQVSVFEEPAPRLACCTAHAGGGCEDPTISNPSISECVCATDQYCCDSIGCLLCSRNSSSRSRYYEGAELRDDVAHVVCRGAATERRIRSSSLEFTAPPPLPSLRAPTMRTACINVPRATCR